MKLTFLLILGLLNLCVVYGAGYYFNYLSYLSKSGVVTISYYKRASDNFIYLDMSEFSGDSTIDLRITVYDGYFSDNVMYYGGFDDKPNGSSVKLYEYKSSSSSTSTSYGFFYYYDEFSYYFKIPKPPQKYLYVSIPNYISYTYGYAEVKISSLNVGLIVGIVIGVAVVVGVVIFLVIFFRRRRFVSNPNSGYVPQTNVYTPPTTAYAGYPPTQPVNPGYPSPQPNLY